MSRARDLSRFANQQAISVDSSLNVGINSTSPDAKLDVVGIVSATEFFGDGSNLTGVSSPGLGTALSDDTTSPLNSIYFTNANLSVASTITVNPPASASAAFTQYANIVLQNDADLIVADGDTFIPDILGIGTGVDEPGTLTGGAGKLRVDNITNKAGTGSPNFPFGMNVAGVITATGVGIGLTNPVEPLHVNGDARVDGNLYLNSTQYLSEGGSGTNWGSVQINGGGGGGYEGYSIDGRAAFVHDGGTTMGLYDDVNDHWVLQHSMQPIDSFTTLYSGNGRERVRIAADGNVAIGTHTISNTNLTIFSDGTPDNKPATLYQNALTGTGSGNGFYVGSNHNDQVGYVWNYEPHALSFATNNTARMGITSEGYLTPAPSGMVIRSGFYDTGTGSGARLTTSSTSFIVANVNGTGQVGHNIGKFSDDGLTYTKVSSNSHLNISVSFPFYLATGNGGFGIRGYLSTNDGSNYYTMSGLTDGPAHAWGAGGYGGDSSGVLNYTWNTRMNSSQASTILAKTGTIRFYFEVRVWNAADTLYFIDYGGSYPKKGSIVVQEIAE